MSDLMGTSRERERTVAEVLLQAIDCPERGDRVLIVDDPISALNKLDGKGASVYHWHRYGRLGTAWPNNGPYDIATIRLNRDREAFELTLHAVLSVLKPEGTLWIYGANDEGMKSLPKRLRTWIGEPEMVDLRKRCRVYRLIRPNHIEELKHQIDAWEQTLEMPLPSGSVPWVHYPGLFAKGALDPATAALMQVLPEMAAHTRVLDFASGAGAISAEIRTREPKTRLALLDHDSLALAAARKNVPNASYLQADSWHRPPGRHRWDIIVSNPPIHRGKKQNLDVLRDLISGAPMRLSPGGSLWFVTLGHLPVTAMVEETYEDRVEIAWQGPRFKVWHCRRRD